MNDDLHADVRRAFDRIRVRSTSGPDEVMAEVRTVLRQAIADDEASPLTDADRQDEVAYIFKRARRILLRAIQERGYLSWITLPLLALLSSVRRRMAERRDLVLVLTTSASGVVQQASALVVVATIGGILGSPVVGPTNGEVHSLRPAAAAVTSLPVAAVAERPIRGSVIELSPTLPTAVTGSTQPVKMRTHLHREERRVYVGRWVSTWAPNGSVEDDGTLGWNCKPGSYVSETYCSSYDRLPEGPWAP